MNTIISMIAAIGENRELGLNNKLLWHIPPDMDHFKKITSGHVVIMGRKTFESIGKPLPNRINIVISHNRHFSVGADDASARQVSTGGGEVSYVSSLEGAIDLGKKLDKTQEIFIIGGASIYSQGIKYADKLYLTLVKGTFKADTFFPDYSEFKKVLKEEKGSFQIYQFSFLELTK